MIKKIISLNILCLVLLSWVTPAKAAVVCEAIDAKIQNLLGCVETQESNCNTQIAKGAPCVWSPGGFMGIGATCKTDQNKAKQLCSAIVDEQTCVTHGRDFVGFGQTTGYCAVAAEKWCITGIDKCELSKTCQTTKYNTMNECVLALEAAANTGPGVDKTIQPTTGGKGTIVELINPIGGSDSNPKGILNGISSQQGIYLIVGRVLKAMMGILGSGALLVFIYGGFEWVTAAGNSDKISNGASAMTWAAIGICVIFSSYAIINLLFSTLTDSGGGSSDANTPAETE